MKKILVVDDEPMMLKLANRILKSRYEMILASSGEQAIELFLKESPDMVLSDLNMPVMSGYELQKQIQAKSGENIPFIFMTADESDENESRGFEQGAADYIRKPVKAELLIKRIERIFEAVEENDRLRRAARTDAMTGLLNKAACEEVLSDVCARVKGMLLVIDLDSFKLVNDLHGHEMGDKILIRFSELIKSAIRENDIAGRIGGDEFIVFCENMSEASGVRKKADYLNEKILESAKEYMGEDMDIPLGCSIGAVRVSASGEEYAALFAKADQALYQIKQAGKHGCALFSEEEYKSEGDTVSGLSGLRLLYGERNRKKGAYVLDTDSFRSVYRFLLRFISHFPWDIYIVSFTLSGEEDEDIYRKTDHFVEVAADHLRGSDIILKQGRLQVVAILLKVNEENYNIPVERVLSAWKEEGCPEIEVTYEAEPLEE